MKNSIAIAAAVAAPLAAAIQQSQSGGALVINNCDKDYEFQNVPATTVGVQNAEPTSGTLKGNGGKYFTPWVALSQGVQGGWSIKINALNDWSNIYQYEYTYKINDPAPNLWYDMSFVNGIEADLPPWSFNCPQAAVAPHNRAYQNATDDTAMQDPVYPSATVTLHLCPTESGAASTPTGYQSAPSVSAPAPVETTPAPAPSTTLQTYSHTSSALSLDLGLKQAKVEQAPQPTENEPMVVVTAYETKVVTAVVTETAVAHQKHRRHEHRHPHGHSF